MAQRDRLDQDVSCRRRFDRAGQDGNLQRVGRKLVEQLVPAAAAHNVQPLDAASDQLFDLQQSPAIEQRQAFQDTTDVAPGSSGRGWPVSRQNAAIVSWHILGAKKSRVGRIDQGNKRRRLRGQVRSARA